MTKNAHLKQFTNPRDKVIVALDGITDLESFRSLVQLLAPIVGWFKIGTEAMLKFGAPTLIHTIKNAGGKVFADLKLNDIPATCKKTAANFTDADMINIHCSSGQEAMQEVLTTVGSNTAVIGVTVLTSLNNDDSLEIFNTGIKSKVRDFAYAAVNSELDGVVCSAQDLSDLNDNEWFHEMLKITPGIQPAWFTTSNDQKRVMTPGEAIKAGATALVIGRAITNPPKDSVAGGNPEQAAQLIVEEIAAAMNELAAK